MDIVSWFQLAVVCLLGAISPGPSLALVIGNTVAVGRSYGVLTSLGHAIGIGWWAFLTAVGVTEVVMGQSYFLLALQSLGACLLGYIGFRTMLARDRITFQHIHAPASSTRMLLRGASEGFLISILNPKIALFFLAIFSHLVRPDSNWTEIVLMGVTAALIDALWYISVALMLTRSDIARILKNREKVMSRVSGSFLIVIALYLLGGMIQRLL